MKDIVSESTLAKDMDFVVSKDENLLAEDVLNFVEMNDLAVQVRDVVLGEAVGDNIQVKLRFPTYLEEGFFLKKW